MMKDRIEQILLKDGYRKLSSNVPEFTIYYDVYGAVVNVVQVIDYHRNAYFTREQYEHVKDQINRLLTQKGYLDIHIFTLALADKTDEALMMTGSDRFSWIVDKQACAIRIAEGHVSDFYGIRGLVEQALGTDVANSALKEEEPSHRERYGKVTGDAHRPEAAKGLLRSNISPVNLGIIAVNIIVYIVLELGGSTQDPYYMLRCGAMHPVNVIDQKEYYRLFTSIFMHFGFEHLASNMFILFFLGDNVERSLGKWRYLILYLTSGIVGCGISCLIAYVSGANVTAAGASGAIFGTIGALLYIVICNRGRLEDMTTARVAMLIIYSLFMGFTSQGIDNAAHIGGLLTGILMAVILYRKPQRYKT